MLDKNYFGSVGSWRHSPATPILRVGIVASVAVTLLSVFAARYVPPGLALTAFGDGLQTLLTILASVLALQNIRKTYARLRIFWFVFFAGMVAWTISNVIWSVQEVWFARSVPDVPLVDILLFLKIVPLCAAALIAPDREENSGVRTFGFLDVGILMVYSFYLFAFCVYAYRLVPGATDLYNFYFNVADAIGNQLLAICAAIALLRAQGRWRFVHLLYFGGAACYGLASNLSNVAIDLGRYYTGSLYDVPLIMGELALVCVALAGRDPQLQSNATHSSADDEVRGRHSFAASHLAMLVALSTPIVGIWSLEHSTTVGLRSFRIVVTLVAIFVLILLISIKQDLLTAGLIQSVASLSTTYRSINRFKSHLAQSEKLTSLGELVAQVANQIKGCMISILDSSSRLASRADAEARIQNLAGKIGQYAQRTDALCQNMLHFAQETPLCLAPLEIKHLLESALTLSRVSKLSNIAVDVTQVGECPPVQGDSSQLLHVFLQLISNATDALSEVGGGTLDITIQQSNAHVLVEFKDSGPGIREPSRVFEPFYTTKSVGKGTGMGLSTCYGIIQQHEGEISCRNHPDGGAAFSILLPVAVRPPSEISQDPELIVEGVR
ncbi:MAG TPA: HAMP domain-containing sensor histidine kinase [Candidatus Saccharimonadales bacterium]|nr:HAMP domain-containing sensor histidine kinase [Candidatus Saccharimonadales bacterium]